MKVMRKIIEIDDELCDGCGQCIPACAEGAIQVVDGKARMVAEKYCDGLGACLGDCPNGAIRMVEREAEDFDPEAVEAYLREKEAHETIGPQPAGCPSSQVQTFIPPAGQATAGENAAAATDSALAHWPVQIHLVPANAPFLKHADLLIAADCTPVAYPHFHRDFIHKRVVLLGCPKFDDVEAYIDKFTDIFRHMDIQSITVLIMEVPCCSGLPAMIRKAMAAAGKDIPMEEITLSTRGDILSRETPAAA
ncbi:MAG: 4Fe-4S binding protein [Deltaproteobacteria bacterium]|nr:4Fe-4S binding protein [Deltaproteobacteria bacterium]